MAMTLTVVAVVAAVAVVVGIAARFLTSQCKAGYFLLKVHNFV